MMNMQMRTGAIYSFFYLTWKSNLKIYAFVFYAGQNSQYVHAMNLGAVQLNNYDRIKIVTTIKKLAALNRSTFYDGRLLYQIFKTYLYDQVKKSYRTYNKSYIQRVALINYGLNRATEFSVMEMKNIDRTQLGIAQRDIVVKMMNLYTNKGVSLAQTRDKFAKLRGASDVNATQGRDEKGSESTDLNNKPNIITDEDK